MLLVSGKGSRVARIDTLAKMYGAPLGAIIATSTSYIPYRLVRDIVSEVR